MRRRSLPVLLPLPLVAGLAACSDNDLTATPDAKANRTVLVYDPEEGELPLPNDLLFADALDGTLNLPDPDDVDEQRLVDALNDLDGWGTSAPLSFSFSGPVQPGTMVAGDTVRLFELALEADPITGLRINTPVADVVRELASPDEWLLEPAGWDASGASWVARPTRPFAGATTYLLVVTDGVLDTGALPVLPDKAYELARADAALFPYPTDHPFFEVQAALNSAERVLGTDPDVTPAIPLERVVSVVAFTTQDTDAVLQAARAIARGDEADLLQELGASYAGHPALIDAPANTVPSAVFPAPPLPSDPDTPGALYQGELTLPYYLAAAPNATVDQPVVDEAPLSGTWSARYPSYLPAPAGYQPPDEADAGPPPRRVTAHNRLPMMTTAETVPMLVTLPRPEVIGTAMPADGWPVVIFQHGITRNRSDMVPVALELADIGYACVSIDMPLHGIVTAEADLAGGLLFVGYQDGGLRERSFGLDLLTEDDEAEPGELPLELPDGEPDSSGAHFINLENLGTQRDNLRQALADLFAVRAVIAGGLDVDGDGVVDLDTDEVHVLGMSLGGIVSASWGAQEPELASVLLNVPGCGIPRLLEGSVVYGPELLSGLAEEDVLPGTKAFDDFLWAAQTAIDSVDPVSHAVGLGASPRPVLLQAVVGDGTDDDLFGLPDQVVPNDVPGHPLSGTDPLVALLGLQQVSAGTVTADKAFVHFTQGAHSSLLLPFADVDSDGTFEYDPSLTAVNEEMLAQITGWLLSGATEVTITDPSVVE